MISSDSEKKLFLIDAYALIFRSYYAFIKNPRYNSKGENTSAILGFVNTLDEILKTEKPSHIAVVFDPPRPNFRNLLYAQYKANREEAPEDIKKSIPYIKEILSALNINTIEIPGFEADDTIGTLAKKAEKSGWQVYMMTPDKDFMQLVSENIFMYKPRKSSSTPEILGKKEVCEKFDISDPLQFIDILAMWGDTSDNIPGIPGVGEKTAAKLISTFGSIEGIYQNINKLKGKQKENIETSKEIVDLSRKLVTISLEVPVEFEEMEFEHKKPDFTKLEKIFNELEFRALAQKLIPQKQQVSQTSLFGEQEIIENQNEENTYFNTIETVEHQYNLTDTLEKRNALIKILSNSKEICFDTETTDTNIMNAKLVGISFSIKENHAYYVPIPVNEAGAKIILSDFKSLLEDKNIKKIGQNIKYDINILRNYDIKVQGELFDTMLAHYLISPESRHNLTVLSETYLRYRPVEIETLIGKKGKNQLSMRDIKKEIVSDYACEDADLTLKLKKILEKELKENDLYKLACEVEFPLIYVLADMEYTGVQINVEKLEKFEKELEVKIREKEQNIYKLAGEDFNISSPKQMGVILFEKLKITNSPKLTKTKQYSTEEAELFKLKNNHKIVEEILEFRGLSKLQSTYVSALPKLINEKTGKIHTSYNQAVTTTGRLSSTEPNLQNIPIRTEEGQRIRESFIGSGNENILIAADYSQIELRIMAHLSEDENLITAFANNEDIHTATASKIFATPNELVTKEMRTQAKSANFGIIYGISSFGLSQNLNITTSEAKKLIDGYFNSYPKVKEYMDKSIQVARDVGYVKTILGRKRNLLNINSRNSLLRSNDERNAINAPIQGSSADIIKIAMINCFREFEQNKLKSKMIMQVHDELIFDVVKEEKEIVKNIVKKEMETCINLKVKLNTDMGEGNTWLEAH